MPFQQMNSLRIYQFELFRRPGLIHGIVSRHGGVSPAPWKSLNIGGNVGDDAQRVETNTLRIFDAFGIDPASKYDVWQSHSADYAIAEEPRGNALPKFADIILTSKPKIAIMMRFADCVPILLYDPAARVIGTVHAGCKGMILRAPQRAVQVMEETFGSNPEDLIVGIGPAICADCYPVGEEVRQSVVDTFAGNADKYMRYNKEIPHLDLWTMAEDQLVEVGVREIENAEICTAMNLEDWFSHRAEGGRTGRFASLIALE
ncbi:MAG: peptidoglycan editing factor PgeF [Anaerolineales bacterium]|nr:peptidoglycan editing factor PgeF [Anaerolineales bacterium]